MNALQSLPTYWDDQEAKEYTDLWNGLSGAARDVLRCLFDKGPTWDGNVPSKLGRDELLEKGLAVKMCMQKGEQGFQALTYKGHSVHTAGQVLGSAS